MLARSAAIDSAVAAVSMQCRTQKPRAAGLLLLSMSLDKVDRL